MKFRYLLPPLNNTAGAKVYTVIRVVVKSQTLCMRAAKALGSYIGAGSFEPSLLTDAIRTILPCADSKVPTLIAQIGLHILSLNMTCIDRNGSVVEY